MTAQANVLIIHRDYQLRGGEEAFLETVLIPALRDLPVEFTVLRVPALFSGKSRLKDVIELFLMAIGLERLRPSYLLIRRAVSRHLASAKLTHCIFNNFIPTLSLALPAFMKRQGMKTYWWVHNQRLSCANGVRFNGKGELSSLFRARKPVRRNPQVPPNPDPVSALCPGLPPP